jgi:hypothetical protein
VRDEDTFRMEQKHLERGGRVITYKPLEQGGILIPTCTGKNNGTGEEYDT